MANAQAMWAAGSPDELVAGSAVIVRATFIGQTAVDSFSADDIRPVNIGVLQVSEVLKGDVSKVILLRVPSVKNLIRRSDEIFFRPDQTGLWFLRRDTKYQGFYRADHPQRFMLLKGTDKVPEQLRKLLVAE